MPSCLECPGSNGIGVRSKFFARLFLVASKATCVALYHHAIEPCPSYSLQVMRDDGKECRSVLPVPASTTLYADLRANARCLDKLEWCFCSRNVVVTTRVNRSCRNMISAALLLSFNVCVSAPLASCVQVGFFSVFHSGIIF